MIMPILNAPREVAADKIPEDLGPEPAAEPANQRILKHLNLDIEGFL